MHGWIAERFTLPVPFAVALVVLLVEGNKVRQGETIMGCDEVDAVVGPPPTPPLPPTVVPPPVTCPAHDVSQPQPIIFASASHVALSIKKQRQIAKKLRMKRMMIKQLAQECKMSEMSPSPGSALA